LRPMCKQIAYQGVAMHLQSIYIYPIGLIARNPAVGVKLPTQAPHTGLCSV